MPVKPAQSLLSLNTMQISPKKHRSKKAQGEPLEDKPIAESYWVIPGRFLAGEYPGMRYDEYTTRLRIDALLEAGFDTFLDLTCEGERPAYLPSLQAEALARGRQVSHRRFSFTDLGTPSHELMTTVLDAIDGALAEDGNVYLHCVGGIGRTGTTVGCYLIRHGMEPKQAFQHLQKIYLTSEQSLMLPHSPETDGQLRFILDWKEDELA
jgi:hypothetical protein